MGHISMFNMVCSAGRCTCGINQKGRCHEILLEYFSISLYFSSIRYRPRVFSMVPPKEILPKSLPFEAP